MLLARYFRVQQVFDARFNGIAIFFLLACLLQTVEVVQ